MRGTCGVGVALIVVAACGGETPLDTPDAGAPADADPFAPDADRTAPDATPAAARFSPLAVNATWTYDRTDKTTGTVTSRVHTVEAFGDLGGPSAGTTGYRVRIAKPSGAYSLNFYEDEGDRVVRHYEEAYNSMGVAKSIETYTPSRLRIDETSADLTVGATYDDAYVDEKTTISSGVVTSVTKTDTWTVVATDASVTVPAGTFTCLHLHRSNAVTGLEEDVFFARGVGKVKEEDTTSLEELASYQLP